MKCVVCDREGGSDFEGVITLQSTTSGSVCPLCINRLVKSEISPPSKSQEKPVSPDMGCN